MFDSPRLPEAMSVHLRETASHIRLRFCLAALAAAATVVPLANAAVRHPAPVHAVAARQAAPRGKAPHQAAGRAAAQVPHQRGSLQRAAATSNPAHLQTLREYALQAHGQRRSSTGRVEKTARRSHIEQPRTASSRGKAVPGREFAADRSTEDRVHAWYRAQHEDAVQMAKALSTKQPASSADVLPAVAALALAKTRTATPTQDIPLVAANSAPAPATRREADAAPHPAAARAEVHSTADDDAAFAEASNIPSTAPTERLPAPFVHGDLLGTTGRPASLGKPASRPASPAVTRIDPRGDAEVLAAAESKAPAPIHLSTAEVAPMPAPKAAPVLRSPAPAVGAITAAAKKPKLDARVADSMVAQTFGNEDSDRDNADAATPFAASQPITGKLLASTRPAPVPTTDGGYDVSLSGSPAVKVNLYDDGGKLILLPAMKGSREILVHQNQMAIADGLDRVENDSQLLEMRRLKLLVALPDTDSIQPNGRLPLNRRFARPWTVRFLNDLAAAHFLRFHTPLIVTSAVRTVAFQRRLVLINGNAAPPTGDVASPHLYGQAIDIAKHGMSMTELAWMRSYLTPVEAAGKIDVEEEFQQACFHLSVYRRYLGLPAPRLTPASPEIAPSRVLQQARATPARHRHLPTALLATGLR